MGTGGDYIQPNQVSCVRANHCMPAEKGIYYYEVEIINGGNAMYVLWLFLLLFRPGLRRVFANEPGLFPGKSVLALPENFQGLNPSLDGLRGPWAITAMTGKHTLVTSRV